MDVENGLYAQLVMIRRKDSDDKKGKYKTNNITSKDNKQEQNFGLILIMSS